MTKIGIIRHGSTLWNKEGRAQGSSDIPLDHDGIISARKLAERLKSEEWDCIFSSHLLRAKQTAEIIGSGVGIQDLQFDARLREAGGGQIEGTTEKERIVKWGANWRELDLGMESTVSVTTRGLSFIDELVRGHRNQNILLVSHGSWIRHLLHALLPQIRAEAVLRNTSLTIIRKTNGNWNCELYNCTAHLQENK